MHTNEKEEKKERKVKDLSFSCFLSKSSLFFKILSSYTDETFKRDTSDFPSAFSSTMRPFLFSLSLFLFFSTRRNIRHRVSRSYEDARKEELEQNEVSRISWRCFHGLRAFGNLFSIEKQRWYIDGRASFEFYKCERVPDIHASPRLTRWNQSANNGIYIGIGERDRRANRSERMRGRERERDKRDGREELPLHNITRCNLLSRWMASAGPCTHLRWHRRGFG